MSGVLKSPCASNQAIAESRRRVARARSPASAPAWAVQSPPRIEQPGVGPASPSDVGDEVALARQELADQAAVLRPRVVVGAGSRARSRGRPRRATSRRRARPRREPLEQAELAEPARRLLHPGEVPAEGRRDADDDDRSVARGRTSPGIVRPSSADADRRLRPRALLRPLGVRRRAPALRVGRRGLSDGRAARAGRRRDARRCGTAFGSATRSRPATRSSGARSPRCTSAIEPDDVLVFAGAEEAIFCLVNVLLGPGDHAVVTWPGYQSLYEVARAAGADVTLHELREDRRAGRSTSSG